MAAEELSCQELVELVTDYLENALTAHDRGLLEAHLAVCQGCRTYVEQMRQTIRAVGKLAEPAVDEETLDELVSLFRGWRDR